MIRSTLSEVGVMRGRFLIALVVAAISLLGYFGTSTFNPVTEEKQHVGSITPDQEIALGLQAAPEMAHQFGGLDPDPRMQELVDRVGQQLVSRSGAKLTPYQFDFHTLDDPQTVNAFALPGGQIFITEGLLRRLDTEGQLAGVLGHEIGHVVARHGAEHIAKQQLTQGLTGAAVLATYDPNNASTQQSAAVAAMIGQLVTMRFGREDELESDRLGVRFTSEAGYDPNSMIRLMEILDESSQGRQPEFFSTHPNPENRIARIREAISERFPEGMPSGLTR
jgi:predicted Zn-dependent protease